MLPQERPRNALLLGLGGGTIAHLLVERFGPVETMAIEKDPAVIALAYRFFGVPSRTRVTQADAFVFVASDQGRYDYIAVDLFENNAVPGRLFTRPFLKKLRELSTPGGLIAINYFQDRRAAAHQKQLEATFPRVAITPSGKNLVAHCRAR